MIDDISPEAMKRRATAAPQVLFCQDCGRQTAHYMTHPKPTCGFCGATYQDQATKCPYCPANGSYCPICAPYEG